MSVLIKQWGERAGVTLDLLARFTKPGHPQLGAVQNVWNHRGDCTESADMRYRLAHGEEQFQHRDWDAVACNGGVLVVVPRWKFSGVRGESVGLRAPYWWAMGSLEEAANDEVRTATDREIAEVVPETQALLSQLPGLEYMHVARVSFYSSSKPGKKQFEKAPQDVRYFRFAAGYGCVALPPNEAGK